VTFLCVAVYHLLEISLTDAAKLQDTGQLWIHSVPPEIAASVSDAEKRRQEAINEVIYTERDFVRDMEYLRDVGFCYSMHWIGLTVP